MTSKLINIVEPTLTNEAGHCFSLVSNIVNTEQKLNVVVWADRNVTIDFRSATTILKKHFHRNIRKIQSYFLYRKLLASKNKVLVSTAGVIDLALFTAIAKERIPPRQVYFYFHWVNNESKKLALLKIIAKKQPNLMILGTTPTVLNVFKNAGFKYTEVVPYPVAKTKERNLPPPTFLKVLFAGAARQDKGFSKVVDLIEYEAEKNSITPFAIQISSEHYNKYDKQTQLDIARLNNIHYKHLAIHKETLSENSYTKLFVGAICIQPYDQIAFADRVSGVTLDALMAGSPILSSAGTWIAKIVERFNAGVVLKSTSATEMHVALKEIINNYEMYSENAINASNALKDENNVTHLLSILSS